MNERKEEQEENKKAEENKTEDNITQIQAVEENKEVYFNKMNCLFIREIF